jgi:hypothetical protein
MRVAVTFALFIKLICNRVTHESKIVCRYLNSTLLETQLETQVRSRHISCKIHTDSNPWIARYIYHKISKNSLMVKEYVRYFFKFHLIVGVEESIVNALYRLWITDQLFKSYVLHEWCVHNRLFNAYYEVKFKKTSDMCMHACIG